MANNTKLQNDAVDKLAAKGWSVDRNDGATVYLSRHPRGRRWETIYCEVNADGTIDGHESVRN